MQNNQIINSNDDNYLSTTMIARSYGIKNSKDFVSYLEKISLVYRDNENKLKLTQNGINIGGMYNFSEKGTWIIWPKDSLDSYLQDFINECNISVIDNLNEITKTLTPHQLDIFKSVISIAEEKVGSILRSNSVQDYMISIKGPAGTGKTYLTTQIAKYFQSKNMKIFEFILTSPTHKAVGVTAQMLKDNNINAKCKTIHSFLGIRYFRDYEKGIETFKIDKMKKEKETTSILFVDESSLIGSELFQYIIEAVEDGRINFVIFIGDPYQLLPIDDDENKVYSLKNQFELTEVVRQAKESYVLKIATSLRERIKNKDYIPLNQFFEEYINSEVEYFYNEDDFIKSYYKNEKWFKEDKVIATYKNQSVDAFNQIIRTIFWKQKGNLNPLTFQKGDMIKFKEAYSPNDISLYHNGQIIELQSAILKYHDTLEIRYWECRAVDAQEQQIFRVVDPNSIKVYNDKLFIIADKAKNAKFPENTKFWKAFYKVKDMFAEIQYIHSSTIHKLQGSTYDTTYIDIFSLINHPYMSDDEKYRLTYVAVTRARYDIKIFMSKYSVTDLSFTKIETNNIKEEFNSIDTMLEYIFN